MKVKGRCEECNRLIRSSKLSINKVTKQLLCSRCNKRRGQNKYYTTTKSYSTLSNYSIREDEKKVLAQKIGWKKVNKTCNGLKLMKDKSKRIKKKQKKQKVKTKQDNKLKQKKFVEGLK